MSQAGGGGAEYSYRQLESLWLSAGGRRSLAPTMAAIAEAESGGNPSAENPSGAAGLWQILGAPGNWHGSQNWYNPNVNAKAAVAKWQQQGLSAWQTYTSGAYKKYMQNGAKAPAQGVNSASAFLKEAEKFTGTPYVWGGSSPSGFDCSGLVQYSLQQIGIHNFPRTSQEQYKAVAHISRSQLKPGDLVFYAGSDGTNAAPGHVAIYAGNGQIIQALETGTKVGKFPIDSAGTPVGYGRVPGLTGVIGGANPSGSGSGSGSGGGTSIWDTIAKDVLSGSFGGLAGLAEANGASGGPLGAIAASIVKTEQAISWFFVPSNWVRIVCFLVGVPLVGVGIVTMTRPQVSLPVSAYGVSTTVHAGGGNLQPAVGIAEVCVGCICLFVAFHNLQAQGVDSFPSLISYLQGALQNQGATATSGGG